jgi:hypothetical protein
MRVALLLMLLASPVFAVEAAEPAAPTQQQLSELLSGNSMQGSWAGRPYLQYFDPGGSTRYREQGGNETTGRWRVDESGQYCSQWPPSDRWVCYQVLVSGSDIYWKSGDEHYPAEVKPGNRF